MSLQLVGKQSPRDDAAYAKAVADGCKPKWYDGILGWCWHCTCEDEDHFIDQQCSALRYYRKGR